MPSAPCSLSSSTRPPLGRAERRAQLAHRVFDVVIVGGGATGAATARDAALRGLRTALIEYGDFASQTSSASSRLIHGGIRYLQYGNFGLVFEGLAERRRLMKTAPHLCRPIDFIFPAYAGARPNLATIGLGIRLYNVLALGREPSKRQRLDTSELAKLAPLLKRDGLAGAQIYQDCQTDDARLVLENILDAEAAGAVCLNYARAEFPTREGKGFVVRVHDRLANSSEQPAGLAIRTRSVVNATGPFSDAFTATRRLRPTLGVHIVVSQERLPTPDAIFVLNTPQDGRLFFVIPAGGRTVIGTTDTDFRRGGSPAHPAEPIAASAADVLYLLAAANAAFPSARLSSKDVISTWAGLRPLVASLDDSPSATSREHEIFFEDGLVTVVGGKLTTMRKMGEQIVDGLCRWGRRRGLSAVPGPCSTRARPLPGGGPLPTAPADMEEPLARHLLQRYGARAAEVFLLISQQPTLAEPLSPSGHDVWAEVLFAARRDHAATVEDVLRRRLNVFRNADDQGLGVAPRVAEVLRAELGASAEEQAAWVKDYERAVGETRRWQESLDGQGVAAFG